METRITPPILTRPYGEAVALYADIAQHPHISLMTYAASGVGVPTVVRLAPYSGRFVTQVPERSGKAERIAHTPSVSVAPCDRNGALLRDPFPATARIMAPQELPVVSVALAAKYGWWYRLCRRVGHVGRLLRPRAFRYVGIEITLS